MERLHREAVLLQFIEELRTHGSWCGETHIQKATYFLEELMRVPLGYEFILYKHGPYSFDLSDDLSDMRAKLFLKVVPQPPYGPRLQPGENSQVLTRLFAKLTRPYSSQLAFIARNIGKKIVVELEKLGTSLYVTTKGPKRPGDARAEKVSALKPHIALKEARQAVAEVDALIVASKTTRLRNNKVRS